MQTGLLLEMAAGAAPDQIALGGAGGKVSYAALMAHVQQAAAFLQEKDCKTLVFIGLNGNSVPVALFASSFVGAPFTPLNYRLPDADLRRLLARTAPSVAIVDDDMLARVEGVPDVTLVKRGDFERAYAARETAPSELLPADPSIAVLLFTSGTTGEPKATVLRHEQLTAYVVTTVEFMHAEPNEAALVSVPPYHIAGISAVLTGIYGGRRLVYLPNFTPEMWVDTVKAEGITHAMVVPTMLGRILDVLEARGITLPSLQALSYGGGRMPQTVIERAMKLLPHTDFVNAYGLTETSSTISVLRPDDHREAIASEHEHIRRRLGSVGRPLPSLEVEIRGPNGEVLPPGQPGEIYVRGDQVSGEYLHRKAISDDGWFATNDGGWFDEHGYLFVDGRLDDVIVRGGENISPGEIEDVLREHPSIADVAVLGLPDEQWGECVTAVIVARDANPSTTELEAWAKARLRSTKTPQTWHFKSELPYNETGKLLRRALKAELIQNALHQSIG